MEVNKKTVYIVLTYTGTFLSRFIKFFTRDEFAHASLSLDEELNEMYSFGRLNPYNPFIGGFVHENVNWGTFKRFKNTVAAIYSLDITDEQYDKIQELIEDFKNNKHDYKFNILGMFVSGLNIDFKRDKSFYCSEFVQYIIKSSKIDIDLPKIMKPNDFQYVRELELEYKGVLKNYDLDNKEYRS